MCPMQWPSSSKVAKVSLRQGAIVLKKTIKRWTNLLNLLLKQLSGIPLLETVVKGTRQSGFEGIFFVNLFDGFILPSASVEELSL